MMSESQKIIQRILHVDWKDITQGRSSGVEENIKNKVVVDFLEALGYDRARDMDFEYFVENKRADIAIKIDNTLKFIVECKSPEKDLDNYVDQALEYALKKQVKYVILTNGKEFRLYLTFIENIVDPKDRLLKTIFISELKESFDEINQLISKKSLIQQTLDKWSDKKAEELVQKITPQKLLELLNDAKLELKKDISPKIIRKYNSDNRFKSKVDDWIKETANLNPKNKKEWLSRLSEEFAYSLVNKLYFFRIAEDRGILKYHKIDAHLNKTALHEGIKKGWNKLIKSCFDAVLRYDYHAIFDEGLFDEIEFNDTTIGSIVAKLTQYNFNTITSDIIGNVYQKHLSADERKKLGEFYTPKEVIYYILDNLNMDIDSTILDPACGSGGFLIGAYDKLVGIYNKSNWKTKLRSIHEEILFHNVFGVDINPFAVHMSAMNLALKNLTEKTDFIHIVQGDSLSGMGLEKWIKEKKTDTAHTFPEKYDIIVGNPPYEVIYSKERPQEFNYYKAHYTSAEYNPNLFALFIEKYISHLKEDGQFGFIVSNSLLTNQYFKNLRKIILDKCIINQIIDLGSGVFEKAIVNTMIILLRKESDNNKRNNHIMKIANFVKNIQALELRDFKFNNLKQNNFYKSPNYNFDLYLADKTFLKLKDKLEINTVRLGTIAEIKRGMVLNTQSCLSKYKKDERWKKVLVGKDVSRYYLINPDHYLLFDKKYAGGGCWDESIYLAKEKLLIALITGGMEYRINGMYDDEKYFSLQNYNNLVMTSFDYSIKYVLALLNSSLMNYYYKKLFIDKNIKRVQLNQLPIKKVGIDEQFKFIKPVDEIIELNNERKKTNERGPLQKIDLKIKSISKKIDLLVYNLYSITKKEADNIDKEIGANSFSS